jgi:hypothetical protein
MSGIKGCTGTESFFSSAAWNVKQSVKNRIQAAYLKDGDIDISPKVVVY